MLFKKIKINYEFDDLDLMFCGSIGEGFRFEGLDIDIMYWFSDFRVVMDVFQFEYYDIFNVELLLFDSLESLLGFMLF